MTKDIFAPTKDAFGPSGFFDEKPKEEVDEEVDEEVEGELEEEAIAQ